MIGPANWFLPARLARVVPRLDIEAAEIGSPGETEASIPGPSEAVDPSRTR
ncbi:MAG TPA: hypothetical protein VHN16_10955 [Streptosporangiaceae bacterium]|nr:hypothetical protein [Streptosporangiaceae bacterium]